MSAKHGDNKDFIYIHRNMTEEEADVMYETELHYFDEKTEAIARQIAEVMRLERITRRMSFFKMIIGIPEYLYQRFLVDKGMAEATLKEFKLCYLFLRKKIDFDEFNRRYSSILAQEASR